MAQRFLISLILWSFASLSARADNVTSVAVLADPSLTLPLTEIARHYSRDHFITVSASFAPSNEQMELIQSGAEANVLLTARGRTITDLTNQGALDVYTTAPVIQNRLALVANASSDVTIDLTSEVDLNAEIEPENPDYAFVISDAEYTSLGGYALEALTGLDLLGQVEPRLLILRSPDAVRQVVFLGNFGLLFLSDVLTDETLSVVNVLPDDAHTPIHYQAAAIAGDNMDAARGFISYLEGPAAQEIFARYGFLPIKAEL